MTLPRHSGFQDRRHRPLGEPSWHTQGARSGLKLRYAQLRLRARLLDVRTTGEPRYDVLRRQRPAVPEALGHVAADLDEPVTRVNGLDALRDDAEPEPVRQPDD